MTLKLSSLAASASLLLFCSVSAAAFADGMPFPEAKPQPILTPLDTQNTQQPVSVTPPPLTPPPAETQVVLPPPKPEMPAPVPESRIVEVQPNTSFFGLSVGMYDPFTHNEKAASFSVEWQPGVKVAGFLQPLFGAMVTTKGSMLGYGGVGVPFNITDHVFMMPSVAAGAYRKGDGYDLNNTFALRIGTELAYQFDDKSRLGLNAHMLSGGASFERRDRTEIIGLVYTKPFEYFSGPDDTAAPQMTAPAVSAPASALPAAPETMETPAEEPTDTTVIAP